MRRLPLILTVLSLGCLTSALEAQVNSRMTAPVRSPATYSGRSTVYAPNDVAATSQPLATTTALEILAAGGNAIDAAVAAAAVLNVTEPHMTGMGGDMFAILWDAEAGRLVGLDASGKSGSNVELDALLAEDEPRVPGSGPRSVTVPGALSGWSTLLESYGTLTLAEALAQGLHRPRSHVLGAWVQHPLPLQIADGRREGGAGVDRG